MLLEPQCLRNSIAYLLSNADEGGSASTQVVRVIIRQVPRVFDPEAKRSREALPVTAQLGEQTARMEIEGMPDGGWPDDEHQQHTRRAPAAGRQQQAPRRQAPVAHSVSDEQHGQHSEHQQHTAKARAAGRRAPSTHTTSTNSTQRSTDSEHQHQDNEHLQHTAEARAEDNEHQQHGRPGEGERDVEAGTKRFRECWPFISPDVEEILQTFTKETCNTQIILRAPRYEGPAFSKSLRTRLHISLPLPRSSVLLELVVLCSRLRRMLPVLVVLMLVLAVRATRR
ncbi:hypothetical protein GN958_ATG08063 [Phytophthora infestans]|uniref:Uncharacterized protein n=1 Tax=Phytophthora infestans TaxID=4787 RepID=A0A8S9UPL9_PHYIN|nr:hypothetical protein GN958_ATG08063 [Phytophthora infestans]